MRVKTDKVYHVQKGQVNARISGVNANILVQRRWQKKMWMENFRFKGMYSHKPVKLVQMIEHLTGIGFICVWFISLGIMSSMVSSGHTTFSLSSHLSMHISVAYKYYIPLKT